MKILGIETSCDETACAVVENAQLVLSSKIASQFDAHAPFGGIVPEIAAREHLRYIDQLTEHALKEAGLKSSDLDAVAVSQGPGLIGALLVGVSYARGLACALEKPLIPVNHVYAHIHGALLGVNAPIEDLFPSLALVASGGHTNLYFMENVSSFCLIARSLDDACGECFDKAAKLMGLPYPGGPIIEKLARSGNKKAFPMPQMVEQKNKLAFSYSGLKTHIANLLRGKTATWIEERKVDLCASFQEEALGQLIRKMSFAISQHHHIRSVIVAGGVSANLRFRELAALELKKDSFFPDLKYCSDNAAMIAASAAYIFNNHPKKEDPDYFHWAKLWDAYSRVNEEPVSYG